MKLIVCFLFLIIGLTTHAQSSQVLELEKKVKQLNDSNKYAVSIKALLHYSEQKTISAEDRVYVYILISQTHKRIFDYPKVFDALSQAKNELANCKTNKKKLGARVLLEFALAYFDILDYQQSSEIMTQLHNQGIEQLSGGEKALVFMQEAYIVYIKNDFKKAEELYTEAERKMLEYSPRELPIVYAKKISLYAKMNNREKMEENYRLAVHYANLYNVNKYNLYACQMLRDGYFEIKEYQLAYRFFSTYDSLQTIYKAADFKENLKELEIKYQSEKKAKEIGIKISEIKGRNRLIAFLIALVVGLLFAILLRQNIQRRKVLLKEKLATRRFAKVLIENVEEERRRISVDLHDSVNNELLILRSLPQENQHLLPQKIDKLIDQVRIISRNLHPVMFDELGLQNSVEQLVFQVQQYNKIILNSEITYNNGLNSKAALQLFRIIQEAVNNIIKYSNAMASLIRIEELDEFVIVEIKDNGVGFDVHKKIESSSSLGLLSMTERTEILNGTIKIESTNKGTQIKLLIPKRINS